MHSWRLTRRILPLAVIFALIAAVLVIGTRPAATPDRAAPAPSPAKTYQHDVPGIKPAAPAASAEPATGPSATPAKAKVVAELPKSEVKSYSLLGVTWDPNPRSSDLSVDVRWRDNGGWSKWTELELDLENTATEGGRPGTEPRWIGTSDGVAVRVASTSDFQPEGLKVATIDPGTSSETTPVSFESTSSVTATNTATQAAVSQPKIILRSAWGASNGGTCDSPIYGETTRGAVIHHTAGSNSYTKAQSAGIVKATQAYHTGSRAWCDIGYNFLVDKYGQIFEGRKGGITKTVRAAHSGNGPVNQETMGVSLMGTFTSTEATAAMKTAVVNLVSWRFGTYGVPAKGTYSLGGVSLNRIAGHRNVVGTECPGAKVYNWLSASGGLRDRVASTLANKKEVVEGLASSSITETAATVSWKPVASAAKYRVYVSRSASMPAVCEPNCSVVTPGSLTAPSHRMTGLVAGGTYYVKVSAIDAAGKTLTGWQTTPLTVKLTAQPIPKTVEGMAASGVAETAATVGWKAVPTAVKYRVYTSRSASMPSACEPNCKVVTPSDLANPSYRMTGLASGAAYYVKVSAINAAGKTITSWQTTPLTVKLTAAQPIPKTVEGIAASSIAETAATVGWMAVPTAVKYRVYASRSASMPAACEPNCNVVTPADLASPSHRMTGLVAGAAYYVKISAINAAGKTITSWQTTPVKFTTQAGSIPPSVVGLSASSVADTAATMSWNPVPTAVRYRLYLSRSSSMPASCEPNCNVVTPADLPAPSYRRTGLVAGGTYYAKVSAINAAGKTITGWQSTPVKITLTGSSAPVSETFTVPASRNISLTGHGYGHGIGMGQYGARGAARQGLKYDKILSHYYPGTSLGSKSGSIRVLLSSDTTNSVMVTGRSGLVFRNLVSNSTVALPTTIGGKTVVRWSIDVAAGNGARSTLRYRTTGAWTVYNKMEWTGAAQFEGPADMTLIMPDDSGRKYRGSLRSAPLKSGSTSRDTVNVLPIESYVRGVVSAEMPSSWESEALKAQSVAARTYGVRSIKSSGYYDICDTTACQVYGGASRETSQTDAAIAGTNGKILTYGGTPAFTQFSSSTGGYSATGSQPYLKAVSDPYDTPSVNPNHTWKLTVAASKLEKAYSSIGTLKQLKITQRTGQGDWGGRVVSMSLIGSKKTVSIAGTTARTVLGLRSHWYRFGS